MVVTQQFHETLEPLSEWLAATEKHLSNSEPVGTETSKLEQQICQHKVASITCNLHDIRQLFHLSGLSLIILSFIHYFPISVSYVFFFVFVLSFFCLSFVFHIVLVSRPPGSGLRGGDHEAQ